MNNTALRAGAQSANNTHMVFANEKHEKLEQASIKSRNIKKECLHQSWQTSGSVRVINLV